MTTRLIIMGMQERMGFVNYLTDRLPHAEVCWDKIHCALDTFHRALEMAGDDPVIIMEDDIQITQNFVDKSEAVIAEHRDELIQFFSMRKADLDIGSRYDNNYLMNQCFYLPSGHAKKIREFSLGWEEHKNHRAGTDSAVCAFLKSRKEKYWIHCPSLVNHRVAKSMIDPRRSSKRQSLTFTDTWE